MADNHSKKAIHSGHRKRFRDRFLKDGIESLQDHEVLEFLLFGTYKQGNTNDIAHTLISTFGSLQAVLDARIEELQAVEGVGEIAAAYIKFYQALAVRYHQQRVKPAGHIDTVKDAREYLEKRFLGVSEEQVFLLCIDSANRVKAMEQISSGNEGAANVDLRELVFKAVTKKAESVILVHNHPSGILRPSEEDIQTTCAAAEALKTMGITLNDHFIISEGCSISLRELDLI